VKSSTSPPPPASASILGQLPRFLIYWIPLALLVGLLLLVSHYYEYQNNLEQIKTSESSYAELGRHTILREFEVITSDLDLLVQSASLRHFLDGRGDSAHQSLTELFHDLSAAKGLYDQVRFLDESGSEVVRVNFNRGEVQIVSAEKLQNKGKRYYFTDAFKLKRGELFISPLDLNIEHGELEKPLKPMLRVASPVYDSAGHKRGIILLNYFGKNLIEKLRRAMSIQGAPMLLNRQGYWLLAPDSADEWGFMFKNGLRFQSRYPQLWDEIERTDEGQLLGKHGLFSYSTVYPLSQGTISSSGSAESDQPSNKTVDNSDYSWKVISHIEPETVQRLQSEQSFSATIQFLLILLLITPLTWLFTRYRLNNLQQYEEIRRNEALLNTITREMASGLIMVDQQGHVIFSNPEAEKLVQLPQAELLDSRYLELFDSSSERGFEQLEQALERKSTTRIAEIGLRQPGEEALPVSCSVVRLNAGDLNHGRGIITFQDIRDQKAMEKQMLRAETMTALASMVAGIAHEINTPVGVSVTASSHLQSQSTALRKIFEQGEMTRSNLISYLDTVAETTSALYANLDRASKLIASFKQVAVDQVSESSHAIELKSYLESVILTLRPKLKKSHHQVTLQVAEGLSIESYPGALSQIISNLVINSLTHAFTEIDNGQITIAASLEGNSVTLTYRDDGCGILSEDLQKIFDPFFTTNRQGGNTGLGMHIIHNIVTNVLEGKIEAESRPGEGTTVTIVFPNRKLT
jgi:PAS domain S-box-containing protein